MKQILVHLRCNQASKIKRETRNGRDVLVVQSATMPDNIVMKGLAGMSVMYPADVIAGTYHTLNRTPAPLGHPVVDGEFVSASDPEGINIGWIGAYNENARQEGGRVLVDKVIDVARAQECEGGRRVLDAINKGEPIHTSTGILASLEKAPEGAGYDYVASDMVFDHDAIILDGEGAATPEQGVGMLVNSSTGERERLEVVNSALDMAEQELDWAAENALRAVEHMGRAPLLERIKTAIKGAVGLTERNPEAANEDDTMDEKQYEALSNQVNALVEANQKLGETVANAVAEAIKPVTDNIAAMQANEKAKEDAELADLRQKIVNANLLDEDAAGELTLNAARSLAKKAEPGQAAALNASYRKQGEGDAFQLPDGKED